MANTPKPLRKRAKREAPGLARRGLGIALTARFLGVGAKVLYRDDCGHEVLAVPMNLSYTLLDEAEAFNARDC